MQLHVRTKLLVFNIGTIAVLGGLFALLGRDFYRLADLSTQTESVSLKTRNTVAELSNQAQIAMATKDAEVIAGLLHDLEGDADLVAIRVRGDDGKVLGQVGRTAEIPAELGGSTTDGVLSLENARFGANVVAEIEGVPLGEVTVVYSAVRVQTAKRRFVIFAVVIALAVLMGIVASVFFGRSLTAGLGEQTHLLGQTAQDLKASAAEILAVAQQTEVAANDEAAAVDETRRTMLALLEASAQISDASRSVADSAARSATASGVIAERNATLNAQARKISDIAETIRAIADKTDILALNASLEGSKAGEAGRGFVLLGQEMRRLSETVVDAVREIKHLAKEIGQLAQGAVLATEEGQKFSNETLELSKRITLITGQQRTGTEQVSQSMDEIQQFTQHALSGAKQVKATADGLVLNAQDLTTVLERTRALIGAQRNDSSE